jgi:hypothetical protein
MDKSERARPRLAAAGRISVYRLRCADKGYI